MPFPKLPCVYVATYLLIASVALADEPTLRLSVQADFQSGRMAIVGVDPNGPAARISNNQFPTASLEPGDEIAAIDGVRIRNFSDMVSTMNQSVDGHVKLSVRNVQNGEVIDWWAYAEPTANTPYSIARDACLRAVRSNGVPVPNFRFHVTAAYVSSTLGSALEPILDDEPSPDEKIRNLMVGLVVVHDNNQFVEAVGADVFRACDMTMEGYFSQLANANSLAEENAIAGKAVEEVQARLQNEVAEWAARTNRKFAYEATMPELVRFRVQCDVFGASVQIMTVADKVITLAKFNESINSPSPNALAILNQSTRWNTLPQENATGFGRYYYRFVNGSAVSPLTEFNSSRLITITPNTPVNGAIRFGHE